MTDNDERPILKVRLEGISRDINENSFLMMEFLTPIVDGCRAALNVNLEQARKMKSITDIDFDHYMESTTGSFLESAICFEIIDTDHSYMLTFSDGVTELSDECVEPTVVISSSEHLMIGILDADPNISLVELIGEEVDITSNDVQDAIEGLGFLCLPTLLRMARSGIDPSSLESEDADSIITSTASDLVVSTIKKWFDVQLKTQASP